MRNRFWRTDANDQWKKLENKYDIHLYFIYTKFDQNSWHSRKSNFFLIEGIIKFNHLFLI